MYKLFVYCIALLYIRAICYDYGQLCLGGIVIGKLTSNTTLRLLPGHTAGQPDPAGRGTAPPGRHRSGRQPGTVLRPVSVPRRCF